MRHRATRPAFTVEVKRRRPKSPHTFTAPEGHPLGGPPQQGLLVSFRHEPPAQPSVDWGELIKVSPSQESTPSSPEAMAAKPSAKLRTGRILPDVLGAQLAAERIQQEAEEDALQRQPRAETPQDAKHIRLSGDARIAGISPDPSAEVSEPPRANDRPVERGVTASTMMPTGNLIEAVEEHRERAKDKGVLSGAQRRAKRHGLPVPFKRGERWKRHLPQVCW